jgi:FAD/FMN-containing dehydrogenase
MSESDVPQGLEGRILRPGEAGFDEEISGFNLAVVHRPDFVVTAESAADVAAAIGFARQKGLQVHVQSTGHTDSAIDSGVLASTRRLDRIEIDAEAGTARLGSGVRWGPVVTGAAEHGLAPITGSSPTVGVAGLILGGGIGPLGRSHGFSSDYLLGATIVSGAGEILEVDSENDPDLLWAIRGGKVGLGILTELRIRLVELTELYGGSLFFAEDDIETALRGWIDWTADADSKVTTSVAIARFPPFDEIPEPLRGRNLLSLRFAYPGPADEGRKLAEPLRSLAPVYVDMLGELPPAEIARVHNDPTDPSPGRVGGVLLDAADQDLATALLGEVGPGIETPLSIVEVRHLGGASHKDVDEGSAVSGRGANFSLGYVCLNPSLFETALPAAAERLFGAVAQWTSEEGNINLVGAARAEGQLESVWPADVWARLEKVRDRVDPNSVLALRA